MTAKVGMDFMQGNAASIGCILVKIRLLCAENAGKIDVLPVKGKVDIHGDFGAFC